MESVDLPGIGAGAPLRLATITHQDVHLSLEDLPRRSVKPYSLRPDGKQSWSIEHEATTIASINRIGDNFLFAWNRANLSHGTLRNAVLLFSADGITRTVAMRRSKELPPILLDMDKTITKVPLDVDLSGLALQQCRFQTTMAPDESLPGVVGHKPSDGINDPRLTVMIAYHLATPRAGIQVKMGLQGGYPLLQISPQFQFGTEDPSPWTRDGARRMLRYAGDKIVDNQKKILTKERQATDFLAAANVERSGARAAQFRAKAAAADAQRLSLLAEIPVLQEKVKLLPALIETATALHGRARLVLRMYYQTPNRTVELVKSP